jgi:hypothetical protein
MGRILEQGGFESGIDAEEAAEVAAAVCSLCEGREGEVTGSCKAGNCENCCQSSRGTGVWQCCGGPSGDESSEEAPEAAGAQQEVEVDPAAEMELQEIQQDMKNAAMLEVVIEGFKELQQQIDDRRRRIEQGHCGPHPEQRTAGVSADGRGRRRARPQAEEQGNVSALDAGQQQMASQVPVAQHVSTQQHQDNYYGPQPGQMAAGLTADGSRQAGSKLVKVRQNMTGVETGGSRVVKSSCRRTSDLSVERHELGHILVGAAVHQAERWIQQWDSIQITNRMSTPAGTSEEIWGQGLWARQQLMNNGMSVWPEEEWVGLLEQQYGFGYQSLVRVVPRDRRCKE